MSENARTGAWILEIVPKEWDVDRFLREVKAGRIDPPVIDWPVAETDEGMHADDRVFIWRAGDHRTAGIVALATVVADPSVLEEGHAGFRRAAFEEQFSPAQHRAPLRIDAVLPKPLYRVKLEWNPETKGLAMLRFADVTLSHVGATEQAALERMCAELIEAGPRARTARAR